MLNEFGFTRKTYQDLLEDMEDKSKELFGENVRTSSTSVLGILLRIVAWSLSLAHELLERVYFSSFINSADGVSLDRLASNYSLHRSPSSAALVILKFEGHPGYTIEEGVQFATENMVVFQMIDVVTLDGNGNGTGYAVSLEYSSRSNVAANTVTLSMEPAEEIISVINPNAASGGSDVETDKVLRDRIKTSLLSNPGPPVNGIISSVLAIPGVRMARLIENLTMSVDEYGNPPKSIHVYVLGGQKELVAQAIFDSIAAGVETVGEETQTISDLGGFPHVVKFDYALPINIYVRIDLTTNLNYPSDGNDQIKELVANYIESLTMGVTIRFSYLYSYIYQVEGIDVASVTIGKNPSHLSSEDVELSPFEAANISFSNIEVIKS